MDIHATRREVARRLLRDRFRGSQTQFAAAVSEPPSYISRLLGGKPPSEGGKNLGETKARERESALGLAPGAMDRLEPEVVTVGVGEDDPPTYHAPSGPDYPALIARRVRGWDEGMQLMLANFCETINAAIRENGTPPKPPPKKPPRKPSKRSK